MKKNYTLSLDQEVVEKLQVYLAKFDLTLSGLVTDYLGETLPIAELVNHTMYDELLTFKKAKQKLRQTTDLTVDAL